MIITATEFKTNFGKYLDMIQEEEIFITKNGKIVAKMVNPNISAVDRLSGILKGKISDDFDAKDIKKMRLEEKYGIQFDD